MELFFNDEYATFWAAISSIMGVIATTMAVFALLYSMRTYNKTMQVVHYGEIDKMYFEILKEALTKPHVVRQNIIRSEEEEVEYGIYAFIVWNFLESIYDRCILDESLKTTWFPIIETERAIHLGWIQNHQNRTKFKNEFLNFIDNGNFKIV
ncbi:MAG: hypothetical protein A2513_02690 [Sulfurimonas sp. RIFOXYD12_FULL_33_39]|uniref:hypothetical protein n=1 Tax=unclassified Sulfurimonas TaxID=2623549 RepID=UPI0008C7234B|nr:MULTISPECIES: hypothetical protein [unclassified Sulfurimonas]OHE06989.1 MAG: hypothetical protein A3G74_03500 [Sulfurimonas sp. RIFCSPLOWO2_12_FULL_34_6]OHE08909.1 MAG: hypothetical protein A2513_02690 [Sulfurimonas sp. RIFOXYD12_FULL_33_39]OHE14219.1 MAG: hypothetical protein A2530_05990 [Sulfurimonas sp. RIFOXYD2_FULL_34_21]DAB27983.1 MAG TPA: hypothetical protein CFH78_04770 [Sulfurimonas sp. UBA10385]